MKTKLAAGLLLVAIGTAAYLLTPVRRTDVSLILVNGKFFSEKQPWIEAMAIQGDRILRTGTTTEILRSFSAKRVIDLRGKPVYPGFIDAHAHVEGIGAAMMNLDLAASRSVEEIKTLVAAASQGKMEGQWIRGRGWDQNKWPTKLFPTREALDQASPARPVYLVRVDGHAVWVNTPVLSLAGIDRNTKDPEGGRLLRDRHGNPTGVFIDNAIKLLGSVLPAPSQTDRVEAILRTSRECVKYGITEIHDMGVDLDGIAAYKSLATEGKLPLRIYAVLEGESQPTVEEFLKTGPIIGGYDGRLTVRAIKLYADGALGSRGAALVEPYADDPGNRGLTLTSREELLHAGEVALDKGFQLCVHAIGDRANNMVLSAYEDLFKLKKMKGQGPRFRVEHAQVLLATDVPRFAALGVIPSMQPVHCTSDMPWAGARLGNERSKRAYAWRSLIDAGSVIPGGSDAPVENPNPLPGFYSAITRQDNSQRPDDGWHPEQRMSRLEALKCFTSWGAFAAFQEEMKGSLDEGKWADIVVLSDDILTVETRKIQGLTVELTVVGGEIVYSTDTFAWTSGR